MSAVGPTSTSGKRGGGREEGNETRSGFFKGVGGESGTGVMSLPVEPRPPPARKDPPPPHTLTHSASAAQVATSRATPEIPPSLGGRGPRGPWGTAWPRRGKGIEDTGATREGPLGTTAVTEAETRVMIGFLGQEEVL